MRKPKIKFTAEQQAKISAAAEAGTRCANEAMGPGKRPRAPCECPICSALIKGEGYAVIMAIGKAWSQNYHAECIRIANKELAEMGIILV